MAGLTVLGLPTWLHGLIIVKGGTVKHCTLDPVVHKYLVKSDPVYSGGL